MDEHRRALPGAPYSGWRSSLAEPPRRPLAIRLRKLLRAFFPVMSALLGMGVALLFYRLPILAVTEVRIQGLAHLSAATVRDLTEAQGANLLALDIPAAQRRLLANPWIADAQVRRRLPATLEISLRERTAGAVWQAGNGRFLVATDGVILEPAADVADLPVIVDGQQGEAQPGQAVAAAPVELAFRLIQETPRTVGARVTALEYRAPDGLTVQTDNGWRAAFGDDTAFEQKLAVWRSVISETTRQGVKANFVDLRFGGRPYLR